jgi:hypothetical protein
MPVSARRAPLGNRRESLLGLCRHKAGEAPVSGAVDHSGQCAAVNLTLTARTYERNGYAND